MNLLKELFSRMMAGFMLLARNVKAAAGPGTIVSLAVSVIIIAYLLPIGLLAIADANVTGWVAVTVTMFQTVLPILIIVGLALKYVPRR